MKADIVIVSNSPGELSALVKPLVNALKEELPNSKLTLVLTPCQYASGNEVEFAQDLGFDQIVSSEEYKKWGLTNKLPNHIEFGKSGLIIFTGGDLLHAVLISKKLKFKAIAYLNEHIGWQNNFETFFVADEQAKDKFARHVDSDKLKVSGNLMVDSINQFSNNQFLIDKYKIKSGKTIITFLPGSRLFQINYLIPFYEKIFEILDQKNIDIEVILSLSPFVKIEQIEKALPSNCRIVSEDNIYYLENKTMKVMIAEDNTASISDLVVTIPGTNTAHLAIIGCPMLVIFPLDKPEVIPLEGLSHWISLIPIIGKWFKYQVAELINAKTKYFALPNIKANREIVPELRGKITPTQVAEEIIKLINNKSRLGIMSEELKSSLGKAGASSIIAKEAKSLISQQL